MRITKQNFETVAKMLGYEVKPEFKFLFDRKFRADWKVSKGDKFCLVEYEGLQLQARRNKKGEMEKKSRHTGVVGYSKDCEKYNLAQLNGYVVLRYTTLNFGNVFNDLKIFFK